MTTDQDALAGPDAEIEQPPRLRPKPSLRAGGPASPAMWHRHAERKAKNRPRRLAEWHALSPAERDTAWAGLRSWVTWLHDRYELGIEERLPPCWAEHPGLIEELWALKAWREEIYQAPQPSGQAARYWHAELRQTVNAANTFYAAGCRAQHRGATGTAREDDDLQRRWAAADPAAGIPPDLLLLAETATVRGDSHLYLTSATMGTRRLEGKVTSLSRTVNEYVRHDGSWWMQGDGGWLRVTDQGMDATLAQRAAALALADSSVDRHHARRSAEPTIERRS